MNAFKVVITEDSLHGKCEKTGKVYLIHHESKNGEDITELAEGASKSPWFIVDNPQFKPNSKQTAEILKNGRIHIVKFSTVEEIIKLSKSNT